MDQRRRLFRGMVAITARASLCPTTHSTKSGGTHQVAKGNVIYLVGENPDDVRMRVIGADSRRPSSDNPDDDRIIFVPGVFSIPEMRSEIAAKAEQIGGVDLVFVDTSATYFLGNQELDNTQMGTNARMLRNELSTLPGSPCVGVLCHPIKYVLDPSQLTPRAGGAFLAEMDGNLTVWKQSDNLIELHHNKMRGTGFEPMSFKIDKIKTPKLVDTKGREISTMRVVPISEQEEESQSRTVRKDEDEVLIAMRSNADRSIAEIARALGWVSSAGEPQKSRVHRRLEALEKAKPKLARRDRDRWQLTDPGKKAADDAKDKIASLELDRRRYQN